MCEISKGQRKIYRDDDQPRIIETTSSDRSGELVPASGNDDDDDDDDATKRNEDGDLFGKQYEQQWNRQQLPRREEPASRTTGTKATIHRDSPNSPGRNDTSAGASRDTRANIHADDDIRKPEKATEVKVPSSSFTSSMTTASEIYSKQQVFTNGIKKQVNKSEDLTYGREMAPVMGVPPPPPPPAPHMGPDGLILPRKPYNPCLISNNHKDLRRELLFNQKVGRNVLNQKSELQRAWEKQRETAMRKEAERNRDETYKDDPRTTLQRALEHRAKAIRITEQPQNVEPPNPLVTARAKLRTRVDSQ